MKSTVDGLFHVEDVLAIAQRLVARLQDAGVTHVRDVALSYDPANGQGVMLELGTIAGPEDEIDLECDELALTFPQAKLAVLRPLPLPKPQNGMGKSRSKSKKRPEAKPNTVLMIRPHQE
jgi:hypothetical protein